MAQIANGTPKQVALGFMWQDFYLSRAEEIEILPKEAALPYYGILFAEYVLERQEEVERVAKSAARLKDAGLM
jgi:hypothetical protein